MITLESAKIAFDTWRASKANINTPAPAELWDMVEQLLLTYKRAEICKVLGISGHQIKAHCAEASKSQDLQPVRPNGDSFVEAIQAPIAAMSELTLKGNSKSLHLCLPTSALCDILPIVGRLL